MRKIKIVLALLLVALLVPIAATPATCDIRIGWTEQDTPTENNLRGIFMASDLSGWAVGLEGTVIHTDTGGETWSAQAAGLTTEHLYGVSGANEQKAWAVGSGGTILGTDDGSNWAPQPSGTAERLRGVGAASDTIAWAVGASGTIIASNDGGASWNPQPVAGVGEELWGVSVIDQDNAWAVGDDGTILRTINGVDWVVQDSGTTENLRGVSAAGSNVAWAVGANGTILRTENGGREWARQEPPLGLDEFLYGVTAIDEQNAWVVGEHGTILRTVAWGFDWFEQAGTSSDLWGVDSIGQKTAYAAGLSGLVMKTVDGGGPPHNWFLAEGSTAGGFETWVLVQNPSDDDVLVDLLLNTDQGMVQPEGLQDQSVPANSRKSFPLHEFVETFDVSTLVSADGPVVCERSMYWTPPGGSERVLGTDSIGITAPNNSWFLAEGSTAGGFETWVLVQNPFDGPVQVDLTLNTDEGEVAPAELQNVEIPATSRKSFPIHEYVETYDVSTRVQSEGAPVVCERSVYWTPPGESQRVLGTCSIGATTPLSTWYLAEGSTAGGFETWVLVQNPFDSSVHVDLTLNTDQGQQQPPGLQNQEVPGKSRKTFPIHEYVQTYDVSTIVRSVDGPVVCERSVYWTPQGGSERVLGTDSVGVSEPGIVWFLAEGSTAGGFETWVLVQNYQDNPVMVSLTLNTDIGIENPEDLHDVEIPANTRKTFPIHEYVQTYDVSTIVEATAYVICERSVYWTPQGDTHRVLGTCSIGYDP